MEVGWGGCGGCSGRAGWWAAMGLGVGWGGVGSQVRWVGVVNALNCALTHGVAHSDPIKKSSIESPTRQQMPYPACASHFPGVTQARVLLAWQTLPSLLGLLDGVYRALRAKVSVLCVIQQTFFLYLCCLVWGVGGKALALEAPCCSNAGGPCRSHSETMAASATPPRSPNMGCTQPAWRNKPGP